MKKHLMSIIDTITSKFGNKLKEPWKCTECDETGNDFIAGANHALNATHVIELVHIPQKPLQSINQDQIRDLSPINDRITMKPTPESNGIKFPTNETGIPVLFILEEKLSSQTPLPQSNKNFPWNLDEEQIYYWPITRKEKTGHRFIDQFIPVRKCEDIKKYQTKEAKITLCEWWRTNPNPKGENLPPITLAILGTREFGERIASLICFPWDTNQS